MPSPAPTVTADIPILSSQVLASSGRRAAWVEVDPSPDHIHITVCQGEEVPDDLAGGFESGGSVTCPVSHTTLPQRDVKRHGVEQGFGYRLYAVCDIQGRDRTYREPSPDEAHRCRPGGSVRR